MTGRRRRGAVWSLAPRNEDFGGSNWPYASAGEKSLDPTRSESHQTSKPPHMPLNRST